MGLFDEFLLDQYYHVFSRSNNKENLFYTEDNRQYFLSKLEIFVLPFLEIHAYSLMGNHYHLLLRVRSWDEIILEIKSVEEEKRTVAMKKLLLEEEEENTSLVLETRLVFSSSSSLDKFIVHQIQRLSISYTKALNKQRDRKGHLFNRPFKRCMIDFDRRYHNMIYYIHHNARKHGFVKDFLDYKYHSYFEILNASSVLINVENVLEAFGSKEDFVHFHKFKHDEDDFDGMELEEEL